MEERRQDRRTRYNTNTKLHWNESKRVPRDRE